MTRDYKELQEKMNPVDVAENQQRIVVGRITFGELNQSKKPIVNDTSQLQAKRDAWPMMYLGEKPEGVVEPRPAKSRVEQLLEDTLQEVESLKSQLEYEKTKNDAYRKLESAYRYLLGKYPTEDHEAREILCKAQRLFLGQTSPYRGY
jgi:hypothetical protein